jgi:hypothetical protein
MVHQRYSPGAIPGPEATDAARHATTARDNSPRRPHLGTPVLADMRNPLADIKPVITVSDARTVRGQGTKLSADRAIVSAHEDSSFVRCQP